MYIYGVHMKLTKDTYWFLCYEIAQNQNYVVAGSDAALSHFFVVR